MSRILWHSNAPWTGSGYGCQTARFVPRIAALGHNVAVSAFWGLNGAMLAWKGHRVYPGDAVYGNRLLSEIAQAEQADLVITLMDVWVLEPDKVGKLPLACWTPVDHEPTPPKVLKFLERTGAAPIAMSRFGERMLADAGLDPCYVPHGVDTSVYRPRPQATGRERLGVPEDAFLIGMVAANKGNNPPRKAFPQVLQAFAEIRRDIADAYLYLHTDPVGMGGVHLAQLSHQLGIPPEAVLGPQQLHLELGLDDEEMAQMYSAFDVLVNPAYGEGFGVPIIEAQACGCPVAVTDCTAMTELCGAGWLIGGDPWFDPAQRSFYKCPSVRELVQAMREAYDARGDVRLRNEARTFALDYDADRITRRHWRPTLDRLLAPKRELAAA